MKIKYKGFMLYEGTCPACKTKDKMWATDATISVNCYSRQKVEIPKMLKPLGSVCDNPLCEWSKV